MKGYIYNVSSNEIVAIIDGTELDTHMDENGHDVEISINKAIEGKANDMGFAWDEYAMSFDDSGLTESTGTITETLRLADYV